MEIEDKIKVLIIDASALVRDVLKKGLNEDPEFEVIGETADLFVARDLIIEKHPNVIILDIEIPKNDGIEFIRKLMPQFPTPVIVVSAMTQKGKFFTMQALEVGAVDFLPKPISDLERGLQDMLLKLKTKIKDAISANVSIWKNKHFPPIVKKDQETLNALFESTNKVIAIGASMGGTDAIKKVISQLPKATPGIVIVQHMQAGYTKTFADRLNETSLMEVKEAESGDRIKNGRVLIAPGDYHLKVIRSGGRYQVLVENGEKVNDQRPSIDVMMLSVAEQVGANSYGIILTGAGIDGVQGIKSMKSLGAKTIAQDEESSLVYGISKVAYENEGVDKLLALEKIPEELIKLIKEDYIVE